MKAGQVHHLAEQLRAPRIQIRKTVGLNGVLIKRIAAASADTKILLRLQKRRRSRLLAHLGTETVDDVRSADPSLFQWLQRDKHIGGICSAPTSASTPTPGKRDRIRNRRVVIHVPQNPLDRLVHRKEGGVLRSPHSSTQRARIL